MLIKYPHCPYNIPKYPKIYQLFPIMGHPKCAKLDIWFEKEPSGNPVYERGTYQCMYVHCFEAHMHVHCFQLAFGGKKTISQLRLRHVSRFGMITNYCFRGS
jgi:hypothetical protein